MRTFGTATLLAMFILATSPAQDRGHARSMVISQEGIVATSHTLASQAGARILAKGGSAIDAAIAANAVLAVTEPMMNGIGGDLFALYREARTGKLTGLNASGPAPKALTPELLGERGHTAMPRAGIHTVTVPGCVAGWQALHKRHGKLPWRDLFEAAIRHAERGYPVPEVIQSVWYNAAAEERVNASAESRRVFLPGGSPPEVGQVFRNPELGRALRLIAEGGADAFYRGPIAQAILQTSRELQGTLTAADLTGFTPEWVDPISSTYRGWTVHELPPNGQGMAALMMLNLMERQAIPEDPLAAAGLHVKIEAMKLAYADLYRYNGDPRFSPVPVTGLLSKEYAASRARLIDPAKAACDIPPGVPQSSDTTYLAVVDREGNVASWIQSVSALWGSGITVNGMGFPLHNRGANFTLDEGHSNRLAAGKRPFHTIIPALMSHGDRHVAFGIMGGANQPVAHAQFVSNVVDHGMNLQAALEAARFTVQERLGCEVAIESRVPESVREELARWGHTFEVRGPYSLRMGRGQAVMHDARRKMNFGASDPRADGSAEAEGRE